MSRRAVTGHGRLLPMAAGPTPDTLAIDGPWTIIIEDERIHEVRAGVLRSGDPEHIVDVGSALVTPGLVDPHTHLLYAGDRSDEAATRSRGERYAGGGILRTVAATVSTSDPELVRVTRERLVAAQASGTTTIEVKSGYGLSGEEELRQLQLIGQAARGLPLRVRRTYLGAHAVPAGSTPAAQAEAVIAALPAIAPEADFIDVFCEPNLFDLELTRSMAVAGALHGLPLRLHADQLQRSGATLLGVALGAVSVDHLERASDDDARAVAVSGTVATVLPGPAIMLGGGRPPVRSLLEAGATVAIGSDANAGTFGEPSMPLALGLAVALGFTIDEALWAATQGGARSLGLAGTAGSLVRGCSADVVAWDAEHEGAFALRLGGVRPERIWFKGSDVGRDIP